MKKTACAALVASLLTIPATAGAQSAALNTRVRVWTSAGDPVIGTLRSDTGSALIIEPDDTDTSVSVPRASVTRLDVGHRRPRILTVLSVAFAGAAIGFVAGMAGGDDGFYTAEQAAGATAMVGGAVGGIVGMIAGGRTRWEESYLRPKSQAKPAPALSFKLRF